MNHVLVINGLDGPLARILGCDCARCTNGTRQAHTSASLISLNDQGEATHHVLFDIGLGVSDSLMSIPYLQGSRARLDWLCLSHWHPDHTAGMNQLIVSRHANNKRNKLNLPPLPIWCRPGTAEWVQQHHDFEFGLCELHTTGNNEPPGILLPPLPISLPDVTITPVTVAHLNADKGVDGRRPRYACAAFVIETAAKKAILLWDLDSSNEWLVNPQTPEQETAVAYLSHADYLFADTAFWQAKPNKTTSHPSFTNVQRYARRLQPRQTFLVHLSGHPDGRGNAGWGWGNGRWQAEARRVWQDEQLPGQVHVPAIGDCFTL
ncbi:MBL fold metallo-hydrolase [Candidatus Leptofilum sp.]|uniref:MBL fold metallo-hydrolase n=1 Tax=Candidatus Leptofilum sp. TaxID=3241576 RepID=UPI003B5A1ADF